MSQEATDVREHWRFSVPSGGWYRLGDWLYFLADGKEYRLSINPDTGLPEPIGYIKKIQVDEGIISGVQWIR